MSLSLPHTESSLKLFAASCFYIPEEVAHPHLTRNKKFCSLAHDLRCYLIFCCSKIQRTESKMEKSFKMRAWKLQETPECLETFGDPVCILKFYWHFLFDQLCALQALCTLFRIAGVSPGGAPRLLLSLAPQLTQLHSYLKVVFTFSLPFFFIFPPLSAFYCTLNTRVAFLLTSVPFPPPPTLSFFPLLFSSHVVSIATRHF